MLALDLSDYDYQKDVKNRLIMRRFSSLEVEILTEIINGSLKTTVQNLANALARPIQQIKPLIEQLVITELYTVDGDRITVDKPWRRYWEGQLLKFDDAFQADIEFLREILNKVPIHQLPNWYLLPQTTDAIFHAIIEKYFITPKIYHKHLLALFAKNPLFQQIYTDIIRSSNYELSSEVIMQNYSLSPKEFQLLSLEMEFNFVCCLCFRKQNNIWQEVLTAFSPWTEYLMFQKKAEIKPICKNQSVVRTHLKDFGFVEDLVELVMHLSNDAHPVNSFKNGYTLSPSLKTKIYPKLPISALPDLKISQLIDLALKMQLVKLKDHQLHLNPNAHSWLSKSKQEQALSIYRFLSTDKTTGYIEKPLRETEKSLKNVAQKGWIYFHDFVKMATVNSRLTLKKTGRRWYYSSPDMTDCWVSQFKNYLFGPMYYGGIVATGQLDHQPCFCVTPFGKTYLE